MLREIVFDVNEQSTLSTRNDLCKYKNKNKSNCKTKTCSLRSAYKNLKKSKISNFCLYSLFNSHLFL